MNRNRLLSLGAALLVTAVQTAVFATDTSSRHHRAELQVSPLAAPATAVAPDSAASAALAARRVGGGRVV
jgi:hypothetical protein